MLKTDIEFNKNEDLHKNLVNQLKNKRQVTHLGGGKKKTDAQHKKGKLTARERVKYLLDKNSHFLEIGTFAAD